MTPYILPLLSLIKLSIFLFFRVIINVKASFFPLSTYNMYMYLFLLRLLIEMKIFILLNLFCYFCIRIYLCLHGQCKQYT